MRRKDTAHTLRVSSRHPREPAGRRGRRPSGRQPVEDAGRAPCGVPAPPRRTRRAPRAAPAPPGIIFDAKPGLAPAGRGGARPAPNGRAAGGWGIEFLRRAHGRRSGAELLKALAGPVACDASARQAQARRCEEIRRPARSPPPAEAAGTGAARAGLCDLSCVADADHVRPLSPPLPSRFDLQAQEPLYRFYWRASAGGRNARTP